MLLLQVQLVQRLKEEFSRFRSEQNQLLLQISNDIKNTRIYTPLPPTSPSAPIIDEPEEKAHYVIASWRTQSALGTYETFEVELEKNSQLYISRILQSKII